MRSGTRSPRIVGVVLKVCRTAFPVRGGEAPRRRSGPLRYPPPLARRLAHPSGFTLLSASLRLSSARRVKPICMCAKGLGPHAHMQMEGAFAHPCFLRPQGLVFWPSAQKPHTPVPAARFDVLFVQSIGHVTRQATKSTQKNHEFGHTCVSQKSPHLVRICKEICKHPEVSILLTENSVH